MSELELVWIRECEVCGREHRQCETHDIGSIDEIDAESKAFKKRCEAWYSSHLKGLHADQISPAALAE